MVGLCPTASLPLVWALFGGIAVHGSNLRPGIQQSQETRMCLARVAPLPKAEGYGSLCTSIEALYQQQHRTAASFVALKDEGVRMSAANADLQRRNEEVEAKLDELNQHKIGREKEWLAAAKKFQAGVASRDAQWQGAVSQIEAAAEKRFQTGVANRDVHWQASIRRLESEKVELQRQAAESQNQKEAMEASTSIGTNSRRSILLALNHEKQKTVAKDKEVQGLMDQIKALQRENAQLVQRCVVGN